MKDLTSSVYTFSDLIQGNFLYVDKTEYLWRLIRPAKGQYFLSRPRRFGKSLTVSTLEAIFQGKKELFKGLAIYEKDYDWQTYPVIHLDFGNCDAKTPAALLTYLRDKLNGVAEQFHKTLRYEDLSSSFEALIKDIAGAGKVVILLDEYDKPILGNPGNPRIDEFREILKGFYSNIKQTEAQQRFVLLTGVCKFSHVSVFSNLNNLTDITMHADFATMLGYTQQELELYFSDRIEKLVNGLAMTREVLLKKIKAWYNGYRFHQNAATVYNPVSLAQFFDRGGEFNNYWFKTGTTSFLLELMKKRDFDYSNMLTEPESESFFDSFEISQLKPKTLLYQTGYLTLDKCIQIPVPFSEETMTGYLLHFPNREVEKSFNENLLEYYAALKESDARKFYRELLQALGTGDVAGFIEILKTSFDHIPYTIRVKHEHYYQSICYAIFDTLKIYVQAEVCSRKGRIDLTIQIGEWIYIIEFKLNQDSKVALDQIRNTEYAAKFRDSGKRLMAVGINFNHVSGQIDDYSFLELSE